MESICDWLYRPYGTAYTFIIIITLLVCCWSFHVLSIYAITTRNALAFLFPAVKIVNWRKNSSIYWVINDSGNDLSPVSSRYMTSNNANWLSIWHMGTNFLKFEWKYKLLWKWCWNVVCYISAILLRPKYVNMGYHATKSHNSVTIFLDQCHNLTGFQWPHDYCYIKLKRLPLLSSRLHIFTWVIE